MSDESSMPSTGLYTFFLVLGFVTGVLWGLLSISPYKRMRAGINAGDAYEAWEGAKKVRMFALIGVAGNVAFLLFSFATGGR